jgi:hypothetical protein
MDDIVKAAMRKWPNVPHCYGWLGLDARGQWYMRDATVQSLGMFNSSAQARGALLKHDKLVDFIQRNYQTDPEGPTKGQWYFQNGPQRVYVELAVTPLVWRVQDDFTLIAHTGLSAKLAACWLDEQGRLYAETAAGFGLVHTQDVLLASTAIEQGMWEVQEMLALDMPNKFKYVISPSTQNEQVP